MKTARACGVLLHPTSLPGPHGSGDLGASARHFVDWLVEAGQALWQVLPLGGIGPGHSPYMSSSAVAGNVLLIDLARLGERGWLQPGELLPPAGAEPLRLHFAAVLPWRMERLRRAASRFAASPGTQAQAYAAFCAEHADWLDDYALFMSLADDHGGAAWCDWSPGLARREPKALRAARAALASRIAFWKFCQWCFFEQWLELRAYANRRGVRIVGDAPIFVSHQSADVWSHQALFELDARGRPSVVAGVPPDYFSATGQRWGNPLYRWSAHAGQGYAWWVQRIRRIFETVDLVRIDHFRGFAAHWEIPAEEATAVNGRWRPGPGRALFDALAAALGKLPILAEDLGVITPDVDALRRAFAFPGMRVLHFAFGDDSRNPYLPHNHQADSVVYTGTHDNDTTAGWWAAAGPAEREHAAAYLGLEGSGDAGVPWALIRSACASVADTAIVPLQDVLGLPGDCRMNRPGCAEGNWEWRFEWSQVLPGHAARLAALCRLYGRMPPDA